MLAADKLLLQSNVKQRSIELREKELKLFNSNFSAVGTQSAIMAGFTLTSFVEIDLPPEKHVPKARAIPRAPPARPPAHPPAHGTVLVCRTPLPGLTATAPASAGAAAHVRDLVHLLQLYLRRHGHVCHRLGRRQDSRREMDTSDLSTH